MTCEGPEIKLQADFLGKYLIGKNIDILFLGGKYKIAQPKNWKDLTFPCKVVDVRTKGKVLYIKLNNQYYIVVKSHLNSGWKRFLFKYSKWKIVIDRKKSIWFRDPHNLSQIIVTKNISDVLDSLGDDIFYISKKKFDSLIYNNPDKNITSLLSDQKIISGCGNYLKSEILYYAKISPKRKIKSLSKSECENLYEALKIVPRVSYNNMGNPYWENENGKKGGNYLNTFVYKNSNSEKFKSADGKNVYWKKNIQK